MSYPTLYNSIAKRPGLLQALRPVANAFAHLSGYRQYGLRYDDILDTTSPTVMNAMSRLTPEEDGLRSYRLRRAIQYNLSHKFAPREEWTKPEEDKRYLSPLIDEIVAEEAERDAFNNVKVIRD